MGEENQITVSELLNALCDKIKSAVNIADLIATLTNCNNCGKRESCEYIPTEGDTVRLNCPLWEEIKEEENCEACKIDADNPLEGQVSIEDVKK